MTKNWRQNDIKTKIEGHKDKNTMTEVWKEQILRLIHIIIYRVLGILCTQCLYIIMLHSASSCESWSIFTKLRADKMQNQRKHEKIDFVTIKISIGYRVACKRCPFALQNMPFYTSKDALLQCKRASFRRQKGVDWKARGKEFDKERAEHAQERQPKYQRGAAQAPKRGGLPKPLQGRGCQIGYSGLWWEFGFLELLKEIKYIL